MSTPLCTAEMICTILSQAGVGLRIDHLPAETMAMGIQRGTADVATLIGQRYTVDEMAGSDKARWAAAERAAIHICRTRGNAVPPSLEDAWKETRADLQDIAMGKQSLVDVDLGDGRAPQVVHVTANMGLYPSIRTTRAGTTFTPKGYSRRTDPYEPPLQ